MIMIATVIKIAIKIMIITEKWGKSIPRHFFNGDIAIQIRNLLSLSMFSK